MIDNTNNPQVNRGDSMNDLHENDQSRMFKGPKCVEVYVPSQPPPRPSDYKMDFPQGVPPVVRYMGVEANYWTVLNEGRMPYLAGEKVFSQEVMDWLREIEPEIDAKLID